MHKGARFYRCDFQVHTPRDAQWIGRRPRTEDERAIWASSLIAACRGRGLGAIAITDHHDTALLGYVQTAAAQETQHDGTPMPKERRIVVFPGMEVTLKLPCQVLVIFDADLPTEHLAHLPGMLGYLPADADEPQAPQTEKLDLNHPNDLIARLDGASYLRGKFIVLPHVREGGNGYQTFLRQGFNDHYRVFRGVGGYTDRDIPAAGTGARNKLEGLDPNWGRKPLGVFQTSDSREADFSKLGSYSTWVKWSKPTAEALRQSCLARHSRLSHTPPEIPALAIARVEVTASKFLGKQNVFLSPEFNALIGGRGTGKSTLLEYIRWALCVPVAATEDVTVPEYERRSRELIENTLVQVHGAVRVHMSVRGIEHVVERRTHTDDAKLVLKVGDGEFRASTEDEVRRLMPVEAYSQKQLSSTGATPADVVAFVLAPVNRDIASIEDELAAASDAIRSAYARVRTVERTAAEVARLRAERESLVKQSDALKLQFAGIDPADAVILKSADGYTAERTLAERWRTEVDAVRTALLAAHDAVSRAPASAPTGVTLPDADVIERMRADLTARYATVSGYLQSAMNELGVGTGLMEFRAADAELETRLTNAREQFKEARARASAHESAIKQVEELSTRIGSIDERLNALQTLLASEQTAVADFATVEATWLGLLLRRGQLTEQRCGVVEKNSQKLVRATVRVAGNVSRPIGVLDEVTRGARVQGKVQELESVLAALPEPLTVWLEIVNELRTLIGAGNEDVALPSCPKLHALGFSERELHRIASRLDDDSWLRVRLAAPMDAVRFEYRPREGEYIAFAQASAGQRATALMRVLLAEGGVPLLIDQPEDDLDNKVILDIATDVARAKSRRQLIFASHNANLVVNGDADLVVVFDYQVAGEQTSGIITAEGAIDDQPVRDAIAEVMEGGPEAFKLRADKYDFETSAKALAAGRS